MTLVPIELARGRIGGKTYLALGCVLLIAKFLIDHLVGGTIFHRDWGPMNYLIPIDSLSLFSLPTSDRRFVLTMCWTALPFAIVGLIATSWRLRDAGLPQWLVVLFFLPLGNLLFFWVLATLPRVQAVAVSADVGAELPTRQPSVTLRPSEAQPIDYASSPATRPPNPFWSRLFPEDIGPSRFRAALVPVPICMTSVFLTATVLRDYGWGIFVGLPFCCGLITSVLHGYSRPRSFGQCLSASSLSLLMSGGACIVFAIEGLVCLLMASPIMFIFMSVGTVLGHSIQHRPRRPAGVPNALWTVLIVLPMLMGLESRFPAQPRVYQVTTSVDVNASPAVVWRHVVSFPELSAPKEWLFRMGIAFPVRARIDGAGLGAIRRCEFSTGAFIEPIRIWDEPRLLAFDVTSNPPPMQEWSPYHIRPPHLENFLLSHGGQFKLIELPNGHTRLEGTTWYEHRMMPEAYWRWWSDAIIHRIHLRVLRHVAALAEGDPPAIE